MTRRSVRKSVSKAELGRVLKAFRENGLQPTGAEIAPDGTVRILTGDGMASPTQGDAFDAWWREHGQAG